MIVAQATASVVFAEETDPPSLLLTVLQNEEAAMTRTSAAVVSVSETFAEETPGLMCWICFVTAEEGIQERMHGSAPTNCMLWVGPELEILFIRTAFHKHLQ